MTTSEQLRAYAGPAWLSRGFRPFFLAAAVLAATALPVWMMIFTGVIDAPGPLNGRDWHVHELLFCYLPAAMAGFILTAVPNWTGRLPVAGAPLLALFVLWVAGRVAMLLPVTLAVAAPVDALFLFALAAVVGREIAAGRNYRNLPVAALITFVGLANAAFLYQASTSGDVELPIRLGIAAAVMMISLIGGRVVPSFTRNWLAKRTPARLPAPFGRLDRVALVAGGIALLSWVVFPDASATAGLLAVAGVAHALRLWRWRGAATTAEPLVLVLHAGYAFVPLGFLLVALAIVAPGVVAPGAALHAWTAGAVGLMTMAVMTRAILGHTGGALTASLGTKALYACLAAAALARIAAGFLPGVATELLWLATGGWSVAMVTFVLLYGPRLVR